MVYKVLQNLTPNEITELKNRYGTLNFEDDDVYSNFNFGILDRFNRTLNEEEAAIYLTNPFQDRIDEKKYIQCFVSVFKYLKEPYVIVDCSKLLKSDFKVLKQIMRKEDY